MKTTLQKTSNASSARTARWVWLVVAAQVLFLLIWAGYHEHVRSNGRTVWLKTLPVDPRDLLRGDYMILNYEISRHTQDNENALPPGDGAEGKPRRHAEVYVVLKPDPDDAKYHVIDEVRLTPPYRNDHRLWVRAQATIITTGSNSEQLHFRLEYDIEKYFVPEGKGTPRFDKLEVEAAVSQNHRLQIKHLWLDEKIYP
ncbi:hypothetical protein Ga0100231_012465 [Opitutaceae bacterium TAV4]|nr:hypothetical protein Ga0100231_012465 [Opitutaceae bacterium TAV4]RRJ99267.1 hypothetical protein Ga0100230_013750 [Opitutaceae bacterium TAV3]